MRNKLFIITNRRLIEDGDIYRVIEKAAEGFHDAVILREKDLKYEELLSMALKLKTITDGKDIHLIINSNIRVAKEIGAYGVQLSFEQLKEHRVDFSGIIGASIHSVEEAVEAERLGADYIIAGHVFETDCKKGLKGRGVSFIKEISNNVSIPVIAIGGINEENIKTVVEAGAKGAAVMSSVMQAKNPLFLVRTLKERLG